MKNESQILNVPIEDIIPNRFQPRLNFDENGLKELSASIKEHGIIQPLVLRRLGDKYEIIAGERRYKAAKMAGLTGVPAIISELDDRRSAEVAIVENVQRRDLSAIEEAKSYKALLDKGYSTQEELAKKMGLSQSAISNKLRLLSLSESVQNALMAGKISERHARSLLQVSNHIEQDKWLSRVIKERLTVKDLETLLKEELKKSTEDKEDDIPIIELTPNFEAMKQNATDIIVNQDIMDVIPQKEVKDDLPIPNKFFNYLEDEEANMNIFEPLLEFKELNSNNDTKVSYEIIEPVSIPIVNQVEEEIELLDFTVPEEIQEIITVNEPEKKDMSEANILIDRVLSDLQNKDYKVSLVKDELTNEIKYTIIIDKN